MGESRNVYVEPDERAVIRTADVYQTEVEAGTGGYSDTLLEMCIRDSSHTSSVP